MARLGREGDPWPPDGAIWVTIETVNFSKKATELPLLIMSKWLEQILPGTKEAKPLRDGRILAATDKIEIATKAVRFAKKIYDICDCKVEFMNSMNKKCMSIHGISLLSETVENLQIALRAESVTHIERIESMKNGIRSPNGLHILTFENRPILPEFITVGYCRYETRVHYPRPLRCGKCCLFGHSKGRCGSSKENCRNCAAERHEGSPCTLDPFCRNCPENNNNHGTFDRKCPTLEKEVVITRIKVDQNISYGQARHIFESNFKNEQVSYASKLKQAMQNEAEETVSKLKDIQESRKQIAEEKLKLMKEMTAMQEEMEELMKLKRDMEEMRQMRDRMRNETEELRQVQNELVGSTPSSFSYSTTGNASVEPMEFEKSERLKRRSNIDHKEPEKSSKQNDKEGRKEAKSQRYNYKIGVDNWQILPKSLKKQIKESILAWSINRERVIFYRVDNQVEERVPASQEEFEMTDELYNFIQKNDVLTSSSE
jgi:hypothetical protein